MLFDERNYRALEAFLKSEYAEWMEFVLRPLNRLSGQAVTVQREINRVLSKIQPQNLVEQEPKIILSILEGLRVCEHGSLMSKCFISLLSASIDSTKQHAVHPAFPFLLLQLCEDEIKMLRILKNRSYRIRERSDMDETGRFFINRMILQDDFPTEELQYAGNLLLYMNHLYNLNLAGTYQVGNQETIVDHSNVQIGVYINTERRLDEFGELFVYVCFAE